jgi:DNA-binding MarR family transcriptional regulator
MEEQVQAVLAASRVMSSVVAESVTPIADHVTLAQYRALLIVAANGPINLNAVAASLGVHPSNATRACDRLVEAGLLARTESAIDRRRVELSLTGAGRALINAVTARRRAAIERVLARMSPTAREELASALAQFSAAAGVVPGQAGDWVDEMPQAPALALLA